MPDIINIGGSGGYFKVDNFEGRKSHSLSSATPLTISPSAGKQIKLVGLCNVAANISDVSVSIGGVTVLSNLTLFGAGQINLDGGFFIALATASAGGNPDNYIGMIDFLLGETDEVITISTLTAASNDIVYAFAEGTQ